MSTIDEGRPTWSGYVVYGKGPAGRWAQHADPVDRFTVRVFADSIRSLAPKFEPETWELEGEEWLLLVNDESGIDEDFNADRSVIAYRAVESSLDSFVNRADDETNEVAS